MLERRFRPDGPVWKVICRVCYEYVEVRREGVEDTAMFVYYRCPSCDSSFPIRRSDYEARWGPAELPAEPRN
ncbi:hypothetical protein BH24ACT3_BH24ACT3_10500 [soil metagenome]